MKTIVAVLLLALAVSYGVGYFAFSDSSTRRFLDEMETLSLHGHLDEYCARLHDDLEVAIHDRTADPPAEFTGGKPEFCAYVTNATKGVTAMGLETTVSRNDFTLARAWLHPWSVRVHYREDRTTTTKQFAPFRSQGEDDLLLVLTFDGVKLRRLDSRSWGVES